MFKKTGRYRVKGMEEAEYQFGSKILKNLLGIKTKKKIDIAEWEALKHAQRIIPTMYGKQDRIKETDLCELHKIWL